MGIKVKKNLKIRNFVRNIVAQYTKDKNLNFEKKIIDSETTIFLLRGRTDFYGIDDRERIHYVIPITLNLNNDIFYWLSISTIFKKISFGYNLIGFSLGIYEGGFLFSDVKNLVFRADWDCLEENNKMNHAQPHWHFHFSKIEKETKFIPEGEEIKKFFEEDKTNEIQIKNKLSKFHFAMLADWNTNSICTKPLDNESQLKKWLNNCLLYIQKQLEYIS